MQLTSIEGGGGEIIQSEDGAALIAEYLKEKYITTYTDIINLAN